MTAIRIALSLVLLPCFFKASGQNKTNPNPATVTPITIGQTIAIKSTILGEDRTLNVYLPNGYSDNDTTFYPVVYLLDGGLDEDFMHIVGLYQFSSFPWIKRVPESIIVGIANTDRKRDFTFPTKSQKDLKLYPTAGHSEKFIDFLEQELQPFIKRNFRTDSDCTIIGESLGGLLAAEILLKKPTLFNRYIIVSPSLWWDDGSLLKTNSAVTDNTFDHPTKVYLAVGKEGLTPGEHPHVMEVDVNLFAEKLKAGNNALKVYFDYLPNEDHATIMHQAVLNALKYLSIP